MLGNLLFNAENIIILPSNIIHLMTSLIDQNMKNTKKINSVLYKIVIHLI